MLGFIRFISVDVINNLNSIIYSESKQDAEKYKVKFFAGMIGILGIMAIISVYLANIFLEIPDIYMNIQFITTIIFLIINYIMYCKDDMLSTKSVINILSIMAILEYVELYILFPNVLTPIFWFSFLLGIIPGIILDKKGPIYYFCFVSLSLFLHNVIVGISLVSVMSFWMYLLILIIITYIIYGYQKTYEKLFIRLEIIKKQKDNIAQKENKLVQYNKELYKVAYYDKLTEIHNREHIIKIVNEMINKKQSFYAAIFNINGFKKINETYTHKIGDLLLIEVKNRIINLIDEDDVLGRIGGDEFLLLIPRELTPDEIEKHIKLIMKKLKKSFAIKNYEITITVNSGVINYPLDGVDIADLVISLDMALLNAKEEGKDRLKFYSYKYRKNLTDKFIMEELVTKSIQNHELFPVFQPLVNIIDKENEYIQSSEALMRWNSRELGFIRPDIFIKVMEDIGFIHKAGLWMIKEVCKESVRLNQKFKKDFFISVNISPVQFSNKNFAKKVKQIIAATGANPKLLIFEITENVFLDRKEDSADQILNTFKKLGIRIAIDDFGTGYSSLSYLSHFNFDNLKIDKSFIDDILISQEKANLVKAIIEMAHALNMLVVAEGVETIEQVDKLKEYNCDYLQGYYYSKPINKVDMLEYLEKNIRG